MFNIDKDTKTISIIKKDTASFEVILDNYILIDGDKVTFTVAKEVEQQNPVLQIIVTSFEGGKAIINLSSEDTDLDIGNYLYDVQVNTKEGQIDTVIGPAKFKVIGGVTY